MPNTPAKYALVRVPKGTKLREGTAAKVWDNIYKWGQGGGKQFEIMDWDKLPSSKEDWFKKGGSL